MVLVLFILAFVAFLLAGFGVGIPPRVHLGWIGAALVMLALIVQMV